MSFVLSEHLPLLASAPDGIQKLRGLILELAVRGKLVPQDPKDEPAGELLKRIAKEESRLEVSTTRRKSKPSQVVDDGEWPFALPEGWQWSRVGDLSFVVRGVSYDKSQASDVQLSGYLPLLRGHNINQRLNFEDLVFVPAKLISEDQLIRLGDIVIAMSSGSAHLVGKAAQSVNDVECGFGAFCGLIRARSEELHRYFGFFFQTPLYRNRVAGHGKGIGINNLQKGALLALECPVPPLAEQHRIVAKVDELMALCDRLEAEVGAGEAAHAKLVETLLGTLTQSTDAAELEANWQRLAEHFGTFFTTESSLDTLKQAILQLAVMGKLVPQDRNDEPASELLKRIAKERARFEAEGTCKKSKPMPPVDADTQPFAIPGSWQFERLGFVSITSTGKTPATSKAEYYGDELPFIGPGQITPTGEILPPEKLLSDAGRNETTIAKSGNILMVCIGGSIGKAAIANMELAFNQQINCASPILVSSRYLYSGMTAQYFQRSVLAKATGSATPIINRSNWDEIPLPIPPLAEQHRIVAKVDELMALCDRLKADLAESRARQARLSTTLIESALQAA